MVVISDIRAAEIFFKYYLCYMEKKKKKEVKKTPVILEAGTHCSIRQAVKTTAIPQQK